MKIIHFSFSALALALAACGGGGGNSSAAAIIDVCETEMDVPPGLCDCVGKESRDLTAMERRFVVASLVQDAEETARLRSELTFTELTRAGMFVVTATQNCAAAIAE